MTFSPFAESREYLSWSIIGAMPREVKRLGEWLMVNQGVRRAWQCVVQLTKNLKTAALFALVKACVKI
jgi:hypothetical protein